MHAFWPVSILLHTHVLSKPEISRHSLFTTSNWTLQSKYSSVNGMHLQIFESKCFFNRPTHSPKIHNGQFYNQSRASPILKFGLSCLKVLYINLIKQASGQSLIKSMKAVTHQTRCIHYDLYIEILDSLNWQTLIWFLKLQLKHNKYGFSLAQTQFNWGNNLLSHG